MGFHMSGNNVFHKNINRYTVHAHVDRVKRSFPTLLPTSRPSIYLFASHTYRPLNIIYYKLLSLQTRTHFMLLPHIIFELFIDTKNLYECAYMMIRLWIEQSFYVTRNYINYSIAVQNLNSWKDRKRITEAFSCRQINIITHIED